MNRVAPLRISMMLVTWTFLVGAVHADEAAATAPSQEPSAADVDRARHLFESGRRHFDLTEYDAALEDFKAGYRLKDDPVFLYNIGLCHRLLDHKPEALRFLKSYLARSPNAPNREQVQHNIDSLDREIASESQARNAAANERMVTGPPPSVGTALPSAADTTLVDPPASKRRRWWIGAVIGGVVVVGLAVGLGVGLGLHDDGHPQFPRVQF